MQKNIIHVKIPMTEYGSIMIPFDTMYNHANQIQEAFGKEYKIIMSPFDMTAVTGDEKIIVIEDGEYSYNELVEIIKKVDTK